MFRRNKKTLVIVCAAVLAFALLHAFAAPRRFWMTLFAYANLVSVQSPWRPLDALTREPFKKTVFIASDGRGLEADIYKPNPRLFRKKTSPAVLVFTPLLERARTDERVVNFSKTFARLGYVVLVPERPEKDRTILSKLDVQDVRAAWRYLRDRPDVDSRRVTVFGLSYGFGPVLLAAAEDQDMQRRMPFLIGFGGYADLKNVLRSSLTGAFDYRDIRGTNVAENWLLGIVKENLERAIPSSDARAAFLANRDPQTFEALYQALPSEFRESVRALSPAWRMQDIRIPLLLLHSTDDPVIPYTESLRLRDLAVHSPRVHLSLVTFFSHGDYSPLSWQNVRRLYLPSFRNSFIFLYRFLEL